MKIKGHLDRCDADGLDGWVLDQESPKRRLEVAVYCGGTLLLTSVADRYRHDLANAGLSDGHCAFAIAMPTGLSAAEHQALRIRIVGTEYFFPSRVGMPVNGATPGDLYNAVATDLARKDTKWRKVQRCILHIGTEKTGSTSLQDCFGLNRRSFQSAGYFISQRLAPQGTEGMLKHSYLASISMTDEKYDDDLRRQFQMVDRESLARVRRRVFAEFAEEIAAAAIACRTAVLSDEHCHSRLMSLEEVQNLKDFLDHFFETYEIVVYLRPQHELAMSQYGMFVANGMYDIDMLPPLPPPADYDKRTYTNRAYFDYQELLHRWGEVFGERSLRPRIYASNELRGGDVVSDFVSELALVPADFPAPKRRNSNISARAQAFLISFYRCLGRQDLAGAAMLRERIRNATQTCFPGSGRVPNRGELAAFLAQFRASNEAVRAGWFPQRPQLFNVDMNDYPEENLSPADLGADEMMRMFCEVLLMDQELRFSLTPDALRRISAGLSPHGA